MAVGNSQYGQGEAGEEPDEHAGSVAEAEVGEAEEQDGEVHGGEGGDDDFDAAAVGGFEESDGEG